MLIKKSSFTFIPCSFTSSFCPFTYQLSLSQTPTEPTQVTNIRPNDHELQEKITVKMKSLL